MAGEAQAAEAAENTEEKGAVVADQFAEADAKGGVEEEIPGVEEIAAKGGWVPQDKFKGPPEKWKPAHQFLLDGNDIKDRVSRELKEVRSTLDTVAKTSAAVLQERLAEQRAELLAQHQKAVDEGDREGALKAAQDIIKIDQTAGARPAPAAEAVEWSTRNAKVMADPAAAQRAIELCEPYARAGWAAGDQLKAIEPRLRQEFPHLFEQTDNKPPPGGSGFTGGRMNGVPKKAQTAADLPKEARAIAADMVDRGLIKSEEDYARNYFLQQQKKAK